MADIQNTELENAESFDVSPPFKEGMRSRHTIMALIALPLSLVLTVMSMIGVMAVYVPLYWGEFSNIANNVVENGQTTLAAEEIVEVIISSGEFLAIASIFQFLAFILAAFVAKYVVSGRNVKYIFHPSTYRGFLAKFGLPEKINKTFFKHLGLGVAVGAAMWIILQVIGLLFLSDVDTSSASETSQMVVDSGSMLMLLFVVPLLGPVVEELLFRGYILGFLTYPDPRRSSRKIAALIVSSLLFAAMHIQGFGGVMDYFVIGWTFTLGLVFGITYLKTGKITTAIFAHVIYNSITVAMMLISMNMPSSTGFIFFL